MTYRVVYTHAVNDAIEAQIAYYRSQSVEDDIIAAWLAGLLERIDALYDMPHRYPVAELVSIVKGYEIRRLNYGDHAVFYRVNDDAKLVVIIAFRHGRQRPWEESKEEA